MTSTKFEINRNVLLQALQQSAYAVMTYKEYNSRSGWADAFRSYVFKVEADQMAILTSNGEIFMSVTISVGNPDGATATFALFAPQLLKAVKTLEDQQLTFEVYEYQVVVRHSIGSFALPLSEGAAEFMERPKPTINETWAKEYEMEAPGLLSVLSKCKFAMADDELRPVMNGVCVNITENYTDFAASDGHLLVRIRQKGQNEKKAMCVLPKRIVNILLKVLPKTGFVLMQLNEYEPDTKVEKGVKTPAPCCRIAVDNIELVFSPIQGRYPNYDSVIPTTHTKECQVKRISLIKSIERLMQFTPDSSGLIVVYMENEKMRLETKDCDFAVEANETIPCQYKGDKLRIGYKDEGIIKILKNLNAEYVTFYCTDESRASIVQPTIQAENEDALMLIMPMLVSDDYFKGED